MSYRLSDSMTHVFYGFSSAEAEVGAWLDEHEGHAGGWAPR